MPTLSVLTFFCARHFRWHDVIWSFQQRFTGVVNVNALMSLQRSWGLKKLSNWLRVTVLEGGSAGVVDSWADVPAAYCYWRMIIHMPRKIRRNRPAPLPSQSLDVASNKFNIPTNLTKCVIEATLRTFFFFWRIFSPPPHPQKNFGKTFWFLVTLQKYLVKQVVPLNFPKFPCKWNRIHIKERKARLAVHLVWVCVAKVNFSLRQSESSSHIPT